MYYRKVEPNLLGVSSSRFSPSGTIECLPNRRKNRKKGTNKGSFPMRCLYSRSSLGDASECHLRESRWNFADRPLGTPTGRAPERNHHRIQNPIQTKQSQRRDHHNGRQPSVLHDQRPLERRDVSGENRCSNRERDGPSHGMVLNRQLPHRSRR